MDSGRRQLVAIMFTDLVDFTALAQSDEARAMALLARHQAILRPFFARFHGREVKTIGDGFLVEFESALDATTCAIEIQRSLRGLNETLPEQDRIRLRIGIHLGDVIRSEGDVMGDAVNIASRIRPLAEPGGICVSAQVFDQVSNKLSARLEPIGVPELKNVRAPIAVYRVDLQDSAVRPIGAPPDGRSARRMAVLPFANMSPDAQDEFFADGLTEELITELSQITGLRVIARTSITRYRNTSKSIREIAQELRVGAVLEGSVRKSGTRIRITAQLVDAATEEHLWAERFDRELTDIFEVQADIASKVASSLKLVLRSPDPVARPTGPRLEAYTLYLRGRFLWNKRGRQIPEALQRFQDAAAIDPEYANAYSGICDCYCIQMDQGARRISEALPLARAAALRALELDPNSAEVHASMGLVQDLSHDYEAVERSFRRALAINPGYAAARLWLALTLLALDRTDEAGREIALAEESDPLSPAVLNAAGMLATAQGKTDLALTKFDRALELEPDYGLSAINKADLLNVLGRHDEAVQLLDEVEARSGVPPGGRLFLALSNALLGRREKALAGIQALTHLSPTEYVPGVWMGVLYAGMGDLDRAFEEFFAGAETAPGTFLAVVRVHPLLGMIREDPRFPELVRRCTTPVA